MNPEPQAKLVPMNTGSLRDPGMFAKPRFVESNIGKINLKGNHAILDLLSLV